MEPFSRQLRRAALIGLVGVCILLVIDSIEPAHRFHEAHFIPVDISVFVAAAVLAISMVPFRFRKIER